MPYADEARLDAINTAFTVLFIAECGESVWSISLTPCSALTDPGSTHALVKAQSLSRSVRTLCGFRPQRHMSECD